METNKIHTDLYVTHEDKTLLTKLADALQGALLDGETTLEIMAPFNPGAERLVNELFSYKHVTEFDFDNSVDDEGGYCVLHLQQSEWGDSNMVHFVDFLYQLVPGIHAQAWGYTEEDPWEYFIKYEDERAIKQEHVPWEDEQMDENALEYIYKWWHEDLPEEIEVGLLAVEDEDDDELDYDEDDWEDDDER
jgi:hypothetical protein